MYISNYVSQTEKQKSSILSGHSGKKKKLAIIGAILTLFGIGLFAYMVYSVGLNELIAGIQRFGVFGFAVILALFFVRIVVRASAWSMSVNEPHYLKLRDTIPAVIIGEATSSIVPLGILISGTTKALAVRHRVPFVVGLASVATENLFYSLTTSLFLIAGAVTFLSVTVLDETSIWTIGLLIFGIVLLLIFLFLLVVKQWHFASDLCNAIYDRGHARGLLENGRQQVRLFEDMIYGFYRKYPRRFLPICGLGTLYHLLGVVEVYFVLSRLTDAIPSVMTAFLLESVSRLITILFKLVPLTIGIDEAGAQFVGDTVALAAGVGVTLAIIRKGRILFWTAIGILFILKREIDWSNVAQED